MNQQLCAIKLLASQIFIPRNVTNIFLTNITSTTSVNSDDIKRYKRHRYIFLNFLLVMILLFKITIIFYHYSRICSKQKYISTLTI